MSTLRAGDSTTPREPVSIGPYRPLQRLGEGGMGVVHLALDAQGRAVAVKVLRDHVCADPEARARLRREVETLRRVRSPHVAEVLGADLDGDRPYLATRFVPGRTLEEHVRAEGPLPAADVARLGVVLAQALAAIHGAGVVHRDVKPANVMLLGGDPVLIDFGIAHVVDETRLTRAGLVMGTPGYLSPEVVAGWPVTAATDWWGWGCTLAFAASGRSPFGTGPLEVVLDRVRQGRPDLAGVDPRLAPVLAAALAADPNRRPGSAALVSMLQRAVAAPPPVADGGIVTTTPFVPVPPTRLETAPRPPVPAPLALPVGRAEPERGPGPPPAQGWTTAVLLAALAALAGAAALAPGATLIAFVVLTALARTVDRTATGLARRRWQRGARTGDGVVVLLALPWRLLMAAVASLLAVVLPVFVGVAAAFLVASVVAGPDAARPGSGPALAAAAVAAALVAWSGPGGGSLRRGTHLVVRGLVTTRGVGAVLVALLLTGALVAAGARASGVRPDPAPFPRPELPSWVVWGV
jgi:predicted Ser/Thr protein kinase